MAPIIITGTISSSIKSPFTNMPVQKNVGTWIFIFYKVASGSGINKRFTHIRIQIMIPRVKEVYINADIKS